MPRPVVANVQRGIGVLADGRAKKISRRVVDVENTSEVQLVQRLDVLGHEGIRVERERTVAGVPTIRAIARAEINQRVARQLLLAKPARDLQRLVRAGQRAVRLEISERPLRRDYRPCPSATGIRPTT